MGTPDLSFDRDSRGDDPGAREPVGVRFRFRTQDVRRRQQGLGSGVSRVLTGVSLER